jgi:hypothetical protein
MKHTIFGDKKTLQIVSSQTINDIKSLIKNIGSFNIDSKYYSFLNRKNIGDLKEGRYSVSLSTFGKKFVMFITNYKNKKYCLFINKKNETMIIVPLKCSNEIFDGSLFEGELVKNEEEQWIFLINDVMYYKGKNIVTNDFNQRQDIINDFLENEYEYDENQGFFLSKKKYYSFHYLQDLVEKYMNILNYKSAGLHFKNIDNFCCNYLYIFPENRTDSKILQNGTIIDDITNNITKEVHFNKEEHKRVDIRSNNNFNNNNNNKNIDENDNLLNDFDEVLADTNNIVETVIKTIIEPVIEPVVEQVIEQVVKRNIIIKKTDNQNKLDRTVCKFLIMTTPMPEVYGLYCKGNTSSIDKHSYASVPDMEVSNFLNMLFKDNTDNSTKIYVECKYHKNFKKWIPYKITDSMDSLETINKIQIMLDSE